MEAGATSYHVFFLTRDKNLTSHRQCTHYLIISPLSHERTDARDVSLPQTRNLCDRTRNEPLQPFWPTPQAKVA